MKKIWLLSIMLFCLFLVGCWNENTLPTWSEVQLWENKEDEFAMKEKCAKYKDDFIQSVKDEYWIWEYYEQYWFNLSDETFVFYSPTRNSCIWAYDVYIINNDEHRTRNIYYKIQDLLTNEIIHDTYQIWDKWWAVQDQSYRNAYLDMVYDLQWYSECYCRKNGICRWYWWDWCENIN